MNRSTVFITGAGAGIGLEAARLFHSRGWYVGIVDVNSASADAAATALGCDSCYAGPIDVRQPDSIQSALDAVADQTDRAGAMRCAWDAFPQGHMKRWLVYSDGNGTRGAALGEVKIARAAGVEVSTVPLTTEAPEEVRLRAVTAPNRVEAGEPFQLRIVASAESDTEATLRVFQRVGSERRLLPPQTVHLQAGDNTFVLPPGMTKSGFYESEVTIEDESDTISENNSGRAVTIVHR